MSKPTAKKAPSRRNKKRAPKPPPPSPATRKAYQFELEARRAIDAGIYELLAGLSEDFDRDRRGAGVAYGQLADRVRAAARLLDGVSLLVRLNGPARDLFLAKSIEHDPA